ncbi:hypothetical protein EDB81DRAFT_770710 [Dactylonectria macrodidyma]|uniref:Uncharacterized protein n=1 Tax=Dactylonectria macrodidyma TaxID=307937 RepID=A0A9P9FS76_9HYPO|nr:hypothetical protein EDB81DRAFT_770710 [Dactylonectria macrodidyma]
MLLAAETRRFWWVVVYLGARMGNGSQSGLGWERFRIFGVGRTEPVEPKCMRLAGATGGRLRFACQMADGRIEGLLIWVVRGMEEPGEAAWLARSLSARVTKNTPPAGDYAMGRFLNGKEEPKVTAWSFEVPDPKKRTNPNTAEMHA